MDVALIAIGSRGDLEPFLALGQELRHRGHRVRLATHADAAARVRSCGLTYRPLPGSTANFFGDPDVVQAMRRGPTASRLRRGAGRASLAPAAEALLVMRRAVQQAVGDADVVVAGAGIEQILAVGPLAAPTVVGTWYPSIPTRAFPAMGYPRLPCGRGYHALTHRLAARAQRRVTEPVAALARRMVGSPGPGRPEPPVLHLLSPTVLPTPDDWPPDRAVVTGPWLAADPGPSGDGPPPRWWTSGPPPVVVSFGSLWPVVPDDWAVEMVARLRAAGHRVLLVGGPQVPPSDGVRRCATSAFAVDLPRAGLLLHHGGFGTGTMALRAGTPQVVVPLFLDHPWWAARMRELGVAPAPVRLRAHRLTARARRRFADRVVRAVGRVDAATRCRAAELAERCRRDDGVTVACDLLEERYDRPLTAGMGGERARHDLG